MMPEIAGIQGLDGKRLALIVGGGVAVGLGWRWWNKRHGSTTTVPSTVDTAAQDLMNTGYSTVGAGAGAGSDSNNRRDTVADGFLSLPIVSYLMRDANGNLYQVTGDSFVPVGNVAPGTTPTAQAPESSFLQGIRESLVDTGSISQEQASGLAALHQETQYTAYKNPNNYTPSQINQIIAAASAQGTTLTPAAAARQDSGNLAFRYGLVFT